MMPSSAVRTLNEFRATASLIARARNGFDDLLHDLDRMEGEFGRSAFTGRYRSALDEAKRVFEASINGPMDLGRDLSKLSENLTDHSSHGDRLAG
jgi:hypothetical protein